MKTTATAFCEIVKTEKLEDGTMRVIGKATGADLDADQQICDPAWLAKAMPEWFQWGNVREQHSSIAAGVGTDLTQTGNDWTLESLVVDKGTVAKVDAKVLKGYSIGVRGARIIKDADAPGGRIVGGQIVEVSLVDRPGNPTCTISLAKSIDGVLTKSVPAPDDLEGSVETEGEVDDGTDPGELDPDATEELPLLEQARAALQALVAQEAAELAAGTGGTGPIQFLLALLSDLSWFEEIDESDDVAHLIASIKAAKTDPVPQEDPMDINLTIVADLVKAASAPDAVEADIVAVTELRKALGIEQIAADMTKATGTIVELSKLGDRLAKVEETVVQSGPVRIRTQLDAAKAAASDAQLGEIRKLNHLADTVADPHLAAGYRTLAAQKAAELDKD